MTVAPGLIAELHERTQASGADVGDHLHPDPTEPLLVDDLNCNGDNGFGLGVPATSTFLDAANVGLIDLDDAIEPITTRTDHRPAELVQPGPRRLVALQAQIPLEPQGVRPVLLTRDLPGRQEPVPKRTARAVEDRSRQNGDLVLARSADQPPPRRPPGRADGAAPRTNEPARPPNPLEVLEAARLVGEELVEFKPVAGVVHASLEL